MPFNVDDFQAAGLPLGGARASNFSVMMDTPSGVPNIAARLSFSCRAATLPSSTLTLNEVSYFGRKAKMAGTRTFDPWTITVFNDEDFVTRHAFEMWSNAINGHRSNLRAPGLTTNNSYKATGVVTQYNKVGVPVRTYEFINAWPGVISPIDLDWENGDQIETYTVEFNYDYWRPAAPSLTGVFTV